MGQFWLQLYIAALHTGCREGELLSLKWANVNLDAKTITINPENAKNNKKKVVPINSTLAEMLKRHPKCSEWVFCDDAGKSFSRHGIFRGVWDRTREKLMKQGVPLYVFHSLRHTFGSDLGTSNVDLKTISELMGHSTTRMTERYIHVSDGHKENAVEKLANTKNPTECDHSVTMGSNNEAMPTDNLVNYDGR